MTTIRFFARIQKIYSEKSKIRNSLRNSVISLFIAVLVITSASGITVNSMNYLEINNYFRIVLDVDQRVKEYKHEFDKKTGVLIVEFNEPMEYRKSISIPKNSFVNKIFIQKRSLDKKSKILFYTKDVFKVNIFPVGGLAAISPKFIVTFFKKKKIVAKPVKKISSRIDRTKKIAKKTVPKKRITKHRYKIPVIVIDPGHGGKDPGALSATKKYEKDIVFDIAKRTRRILYEYSKKGLLVLLTREKDEFIKLEDRLEFADKNNADAFVSIHANASTSSKSRGIEIYYKGKASDKDAEMLARFENSANMTGIKNFNKIRNKTVTKILLDMMQTKNLRDSSLLAQSVTDKLQVATKRYYRKKRRGLKRAEFHVLQSIKTPSALVEVGFLTNRTDARLLRKKWYRELIATAISDAIISYLINSTKEHTRNLKELETKIKYKKMLTYKVKKGDTLSGIAKKYDVDLRDIKRLNFIKNVNCLKVGQEIKILKLK